MASGVKPRVKVPKSASAGEAITIKTLISHPMESGQRKDGDGNPIPRSIINHFTCTFNGETVIDVKMEPAISTNPYFEFEATVPESGTFEFTWQDDDGSTYTETKEITVG
ncbi:thiosulfate oxidation carrier complex protein SoxZ [Vannielia litorea]|uniref:thiosulfate oxidation carrier complex protein SoxZ n=1 Tax=Vannielia TaxID=2813041 RepID=UPI001C93CD7A|nr:thiosulfate oxidation carrier complex protein SoxZ [Vannielia litorea]MBY6048544.1 thiosulfate oxidation carrier complex protein SoxZ [Vannielia litorea]MBY6075958.1 thiosulfate oxidation carrier complex protein SoxZ [Vannielia litorea]MBY6154174.1 thiosulfate oxidation carrier complex protein SoxZ [Vannielia litorea]